MKQAYLILPNQLFDPRYLDKSVRNMCLIEDKRFFSDLKFHKKKLIFHRASMKCYQNELVEAGFDVRYIGHKDTLKKNFFNQLFKQQKLSRILLFDPVDHDLEKRIRTDFKKSTLDLEILKTPQFLCDKDDFQSVTAKSGRYSMTSFYISQRKKTNILMQDRKPVSGKYSYDPENRKKLPRDMKVPALTFPKEKGYVLEAKTYIEKHFESNPGSLDGFFYPVTRKDAKAWLKDFIHHRLDSFGPYEDAISRDHCFIFHSVLSPLLNSGLLTPDQVINEILNFAEKNKIQMSSLEGFIRQVLGWREFMRIMYKSEYQKLTATNFWSFKRKLPSAFYNASTGVKPVDRVIERVLQNAYAHHIERLMVLGNFMLLCEISPAEVCRWFMELFIDAYDWVMIPNVYGMSQYAAGGLMTTKPYISSSNYIRKMSDFPKGDWCEIWDGLYWRFIHKHKDFFKKNPRMRVMVKMLEKQGKQKLKKHLKTAEVFMNNLYG